MATKPEAAKPEDEEPVKAPAKSKKMLIIIIGVVLVLVLAGVGAYFYISKQRAAAAADGDEAAPAAVVHAPPKTPPVYLPLDNMVVNLADPGGEKVAQIGITLEVVDSKGSDAVKAYLPTIRSGILMLIAQRTAEDLLSQEGKQSLAKDILQEASIPFGGHRDEREATATTAKKKKPVKKADATEYPVVGVLFSSFIVQ